MSRLRLDFSLSSAQERSEFINKYIEDEKFQKRPLTEEELEMCGNYILWGRDENGQNSVQKGDVEIPTRNTTWNSHPEVESLDELVENPSFNEALIRKPSMARPLQRREVFSRENALKKAPAATKVVLQDLFKRIDRLDLIINYYDLDHGKRKNPPRPELLQRFSEEEQEVLKQKACGLKQYTYLKLRHLLVELRREQFSIRDSYSEPIMRRPQAEVQIVEDMKPIFDADIKVLPLGLKSNDRRGSLIFRENLVPKQLSEEDLRVISNFIWSEVKEENVEGAPSKKNTIIFDFRELEHLYQLTKEWANFQVSEKEVDIDSSAIQIMDTFLFYYNRAQLTDIQREIFQMKVRKIRNQEIANYINQKYGKSYTANYISTIFRQKILRKINEAARQHRNQIEMIFFPEEFKKCTKCGRYLPKNKEYFSKKAKAQDGFSSKCKCCEKEAREEKRRLNK